MHIGADPWYDGWNFNEEWEVIVQHCTAYKPCGMLMGYKAEVEDQHFTSMTRWCISTYQGEAYQPSLMLVRPLGSRYHKFKKNCHNKHEAKWNILFIFGICPRSANRSIAT